MALLLTSGPSVEPVSLDEAKAHLRVDHADEDVLIASLIMAARIHLEKLLGLVFITQQWNLVFDTWPRGNSIVLPLAPVQTVTAVRLYDEQDEVSLVDPSFYALDAISDPPRLVWRGSGAPVSPGRLYNGIEIALTLGYGAAGTDVPQPLRQALLLLVAHWYEHREFMDMESGTRQIPDMVAMLTNAYRRVRL